jgi:hypothetical protein
MNKILVSTILAFCLFSGIVYAPPTYDLSYTNRNITLNLSNATPTNYSTFDIWVNESYIFSVGGADVSWGFHLQLFNWNGGYTGNSINLTNASGHIIEAQFNSFNYNGSHYGATLLGGAGGDNDYMLIFNSTFHAVDNFTIAGGSEAMETGGYIDPYWLPTSQLSDNILYLNETGSNVINISVAPRCLAPVGVMGYDTKIYVFCYNSSNEITFIDRYHNDTSYENYQFNLTNTTDIGMNYCNITGGNPLGITTLFDWAYVICQGGSNPNLKNVYEFTIDSQWSSGWGNITNDVTESIQQLFGVQLHAQALMLYSIGWAAFFALLAAVMVRKQVIVLFTSIFTIGIIAFAWVGWLPIEIMLVVITISSLFVALKIRGFLIGDD